MSIKIENEFIKVNLIYQKVKEGDIFPKDKIIHRSPDGKMCVSVNSTVLEGSGKRIFFHTSEKVYVDEDGRLIPSSDIQDWLVEEDKESPVNKFEQNMKKDGGVVIEKTFPRDFLRGFVISDIYELICEDEVEKWNLWKIAKYLWDTNQIGAIKEVILSSGYTVRSGLIVPHVDEKNGNFYLEMQLTTKKREPNAMNIPTETPDVSKKQEDDKSKYVTQLFNPGEEQVMNYSIDDPMPWVDNTWIAAGTYPVMDIGSDYFTIIADTYDDKGCTLLNARNQEIYIDEMLYKYTPFDDPYVGTKNPPTLPKEGDVVIIDGKKYIIMREFSETGGIKKPYRVKLENGKVSYFTALDKETGNWSALISLGKGNPVDSIEDYVEDIASRIEAGQYDKAVELWNDFKGNRVRLYNLLKSRGISETTLGQLQFYGYPAINPVYPTEVNLELSNDVGTIIFQQLGGGVFPFMTGAKNFIKGEDFLQFSIPRAKNGINKVRITLNAMDTYDVDFMKVRMIKQTRVEVKTISSHKDVYNDQLKLLFESETGLRTSLNPNPIETVQWPTKVYVHIYDKNTGYKLTEQFIPTESYKEYLKTDLDMGVDGGLWGYPGKTIYMIKENPGKKAIFHEGNVMVEEYDEGWVMYHDEHGLYKELERIKKSDNEAYHKQQLDTILNRAKMFASGQWSIKNPGLPTKEFWNKVYPEVQKRYRKFGKKKGDEIARKVVGSIWHHKMKPSTKDKYEKIRIKREAKENPYGEFYGEFECPDCDSDVSYSGFYDPPTRDDPGTLEVEIEERKCKDECEMKNSDLEEVALEIETEKGTFYR